MIHRYRQQAGSYNGFVLSDPWAPGMNLVSHKKWAPNLVGVPIFCSAHPLCGRRCVLRINAVFQRFAWLERNGVAGLDFDGLTGLRVFAGACAAVALQEGAEADQRHAVLAVQGAGDFFENGVENAVGLFFGEICFFRDGGGEFWFTH
ncbi:hypothetical protein EMIT0P44_10170 [Pseudomonas sp. IT-P44]